MSYLIIGQGLAGTFLAMQMEANKLDYRMADVPQLSSSSKVAAGIINPIVLKRFKKVHQAESFTDGLPDFYRMWEEKLQRKFYFPIPLKHIFRSVGEINQWSELSEKAFFRHYLGEIQPNPNSAVIAPLGLGLMHHIAYVDTAALLQGWREKMLREDKLETREISWTEDQLRHDSRQKVWCSGHLLRKQKDVPPACFSPTRGELMIIHAPALQEQHMLHAGIFIIPLGNDRYRIGASYHHHGLEDSPSVAGGDFLERELQKIYQGPYEIIDHQAGVRPNTSDRKPLLGEVAGNYVFNGLGSRGALMGPSLARMMVDYLEEGVQLPAEYNIQRFSS